VDPLRENDALDVGIGSIDVGHRTLAALVDALDRAVQRGEDAEEIGDLLLHLEAETSQHFAVEQDLMAATRYPGRRDHMDEHSRLVQRLSALLEDHAAGRTKLTSDEIRSLRDWLMGHIHDSDRALGVFLRAAGHS
jgi:hemerythrin-like metal-binding protein